MTTETLLAQTYGNVFEKELIAEMIKVAQIKEFTKGEILIDVDRYIRTMPLLISGAIKVMREDFDAGELLLYFIEKGGTCALTLNCCVSDKKSEIRAIAETDGLLAMIPIGKMEEWMQRYRTWRAFVLESYHTRFNELLQSVDSIAFMNMNDRVMKYLQERSRIEKSNKISKTHQEIAYDLNTSRVVISRLLKHLENQKRIKLNRNSIELL